MYFVLAILGMEDVINFVGPGMESYDSWRRRNEGRPFAITSGISPRCLDVRGN
jgi:hypothetical protein